jgi:hypothetical protein
VTLRPDEAVLVRTDFATVMAKVSMRLVPDRDLNSRIRL